MKKLCLLFLLFVGYLQTGAQNQNLYYRVDVGTNNLYSFAIANLATGWTNALVDRMLFDNAYTYTYIQAPSEMNTKSYSVTGITARDLFSDLTLGGKLGYQSFNPGFVNWGAFASAHYRVNQFKTEGIIDGDLHHDIQRLLLGGGICLNFGDIESSTHFIFEASLRYEMPISYNRKGDANLSDVLNSGLSSHYAIRVNGNGFFQGLGIYADIPHYNLFKSHGEQAQNFKMFTFGLIYTITPWKIKRLY